MKENKGFILIMVALLLIVTGFVVFQVNKANREAASIASVMPTIHSDRAEANKEQIAFLKHVIYRCRWECDNK